MLKAVIEYFYIYCSILHLILITITACNIDVVGLILLNYGGVIMERVTAYTTKEAADTLAVSTSSIRKYASALEGAGHSFAKTESGARLITEIDLKTLLRMKKLIGSGKTYLQAAAEAAKSAKVTEMIIKSVEEPNEVEELKQIIVQLVSDVGSLRSEIKELTYNQKHLLEKISQDRLEVLKKEETELTAEDEQRISKPNSGKFFKWLFRKQ